MPRFGQTDPSIELSNLVALARLDDKSIVNRAEVLQSMRSTWGRDLAEALLPDPASSSRKTLSAEQEQDLQAVHALAGSE